ncbi:MAG: hypothetical protein IKO15_07640 [Clostridiales bacterium]|nr:hypothetical protein [Clostridiales bacterium]
MADYLNIIQLVTGILSAGLIFAGIIISVKKLNPEKYEEIPVRTTVISTLLIVCGLLVFSVTKTCTNLTIETEEQYELWSVYLASAGEVIEFFGFVAFIPILFRLFRPKSQRKDEEEIIEETSEEPEIC